MVGLERLLIGRTLDGRYTIEELIGQGRGGLVYRARHPHTGVEVALKVLAAPRTPEARERFRKLVAGEVRAAAGVEHPNVAGVYCLGHDAELDLDFVTSELLRGQTLASVLSQRGKPPIALGLRLLAEAADGLAAGHRAGLVHRDLRPASLYLVRSDAERQVRVKVAGFGVPQIVRRDSLAGAAPEVGAYASPELLAAGSLRLTPASDVFSLGVVGYELLTGHPPFDETACRALAAGQTIEAEPPADVAASVPPQVVDAVLQALRCNPAERLADGAAFAAALQQPVRQVMAVGKIAPAAAQPAPEPRPTAASEVAPPPSAAAPPPSAAIAPAAIAAAALVPAAVADDDAPVVDVADLAADEPAADLPVLAAVEAEASAPTAAPPAAAPPISAPVADAPAPAAAELAAPAVVATQPETTVSAPAESLATAAAASAESPAAGSAAGAATVAPPPAAAPPAPPRDLTRKPAPKPAPGRVGPAAPDLELYYPPQVPKPPVAAPVAFTAAPPAPPAPQPAAVVEAPAAIESPQPPAAAPAPAGPAAVAAPTAAAAPRPAPVAETPAPQPAATSTPMPGAARRRAAAASAGGFRGSAMAAGFVLGILVLGSAAWMATRHTRPTVSAAAPLANQLARGPAPTPSATPAQSATAAQPAASTPAVAADTANRTAEQRAADLRKKQQDDERRRQEQEKARQAELLQQQQLAQQQARPGAAPPAAPQPAPAQPQQVAAAQPQRPAAQPVAPPPAPNPAPAATREEPEAAPPSASTVFDEDGVEERPRLTNINELQRALQDRYPAQLYANRVAGRVTASFVVGADGRVDPGSIRIVSSPNPGFNTPTASVLRRARFRPARVKGQPVRVQVTMPIAWTLDQ